MEIKSKVFQLLDSEIRFLHVHTINTDQEIVPISGNGVYSIFGEEG